MLQSEDANIVKFKILEGKVELTGKLKTHPPLALPLMRRTVCAQRALFQQIQEQLCLSNLVVGYPIYQEKFR